MEITLAMNMLNENLGNDLSKSPQVIVAITCFSKLTKVHTDCADNTSHISVLCMKDAMKLSKTHLRNKTGDGRLSDLAVLFVHKQRVVHGH